MESMGLGFWCFLLTALDAWWMWNVSKWMTSHWRPRALLGALLRPSLIFCGRPAYIDRLQRHNCTISSPLRAHPRQTNWSLGKISPPRVPMNKTSSTFFSFFGFFLPNFYSLFLFAFKFPPNTIFVPSQRNWITLRICH